MIRRIFVFSAFTCVALLMSSTSLSAVPVQQSGAQTYHLSKTFSGTEPCTGEVLTGRLDAVFVVAVAWTGTGGLHATIHVGFHGELTGTAGSVYRFSVAGTEDFDTVAVYFDVPLHAEAVSLGSARNFKIGGFSRIYADGSPAEVTFTTSCGG